MAVATVGRPSGNDFIELFNRGTSVVRIDGWSVQYAAATGTTWDRTPLSGTIQPGQYYLIQEDHGNGGTASLPSPDVTGGINLSATAGKLALVSSNSVLSGSAPSGSQIVDFDRLNGTQLHVPNSDLRSSRSEWELERGRARQSLFGNKSVTHAARDIRPDDGAFRVDPRGARGSSAQWIDRCELAVPEHEPVLDTAGNVAADDIALRVVTQGKSRRGAGRIDCLEHALP